MSYIRADEILPIEIIELIQKYVDGQNIYIPRKSDNRVVWGSRTNVRDELCTRNQQIYFDFVSGKKISELAENYYLSTKSIQRIIREEKKKLTLSKQRVSEKI